MLAAWVALLAAVLSLLAAAWTHDGLAAVRLVLMAGAVGATAGLVRHVRRTNVALARFVEALRHGDLQFRIDPRGGAGFDDLADALAGAMRTLGDARSRDREELRYWEALVDDLPVAVLTADALHGVRPANKAARRLFDAQGDSDAAAFARYGAGLAKRLEFDGPLGSAVLPLRLDGGVQRAIVRAGTLARLGTPVRVVAVEPVQATLDAAEMGAQTDLVRVLTHEILNSLTPVTSLAGTAAALLREPEPDIAAARLAVETLARRADGMRRFINSYRDVARSPEPQRRRFAAEPFAAELARLFASEWGAHRLTVATEPGLVLDADPDLLAQALINLLRNAAQAASRDVRLTMAAGSIAVEDDGPGIPADLLADVFLPFFTTRPDGTGVGLNLVRQIAVAHGWRVEAGVSDALGGAALRVSMPV